MNNDLVLFTNISEDIINEECNKLLTLDIKYILNFDVDECAAIAFEKVESEPFLHRQDLNNIVIILARRIADTVKEDMFNKLNKLHEHDVILKQSKYNKMYDIGSRDGELLGRFMKVITVVISCKIVCDYHNQYIKINPLKKLYDIIFENGVKLT